MPEICHVFRGLINPSIDYLVKSVKSIRTSYEAYVTSDAAIGGKKSSFLKSLRFLQNIKA